MECIHSSGKKRVLCLLFEGIPVGEDECLFGGPREYRAVAATACQIFRIPAEVFKRRAEASPALALKLFQISARKSQVLGRMLIRDSFLSVRGVSFSSCSPCQSHTVQRRGRGSASLSG